MIVPRDDHVSFLEGFPVYTAACPWCAPFPGTSAHPSAEITCSMYPKLGRDPQGTWFVIYADCRAGEYATADLPKV